MSERWPMDVSPEEEGSEKEKKIRHLGKMLTSYKEAWHFLDTKVKVLRKEIEEQTAERSKLTQSQEKCYLDGTTEGPEFVEARRRNRAERKRLKSEMTHWSRFKEAYFLSYYDIKNHLKTTIKELKEENNETM